TLEKTVWTVVVWFVFGLFVLGPLATVVAFSFTSSVLTGRGTFTLMWYGQLFSQPGLYGPLIRSFEIAVIVVVFSRFSARSSPIRPSGRESSARRRSTPSATSRLRS